MAKRFSKSDYAAAANANELMIAELGEVCMGIGTIEELEGLIADGILPEETTLRDARPSDF
jgi:hypothetical protein